MTSLSFKSRDESQLSVPKIGKKKASHNLHCFPSFLAFSDAFLPDAGQLRCHVSFLFLKLDGRVVLSHDPFFMWVYVLSHHPSISRTHFHFLLPIIILFSVYLFSSLCREWLYQIIKLSCRPVQRGCGGWRFWAL